MSTTTIKPTPGRIVWYRGADGEIRAAIVARVNGDFNLNLYVFPLDGMDDDCCVKENVTHADPEREPDCFPSWHWMPYQIDQAKKHASTDSALQRPPLGAAFPGYSAMQPHQQRVIDEKCELEARLAKLIPFFDTPIFAALDEAEKSRLERQEEAMKAYGAILTERIAAFTAAASAPV